MPGRRYRKMPPKSSKVQAFSVREFFDRFPTEDACLEHLMGIRYGLRHNCIKCHQVSTFHKLADRPAYTCAHCGANVHPCGAGSAVRRWRPWHPRGGPTSVAPAGVVYYTP